MYFSDADRILQLAKCLEDVRKIAMGLLLSFWDKFYRDASVLSRPSRKKQNKSINLF